MSEEDNFMMRHLFAGLAMLAIISKLPPMGTENGDKGLSDAVAIGAYGYADAMIEVGKLTLEQRSC